MIRKAHPEDIPKLVEMQQAVEAEEAIHGYQADDTADWDERELKWTLVAVEGDGVIGFIHCLPRPYDGECVFPVGSRILEILDLIVLPPYRGKGIGHTLVRSIHVQAQQDGFSHLRVYSASKRFDDIVRFYRSCGFSPWYLEMTMPTQTDPPG